jgi:hypothetical protein
VKSAPNPRRSVQLSAAHPGFAALVKKGVPAGALQKAAANASAAAKKKNPRLKKVPTKGSKRQPGGTYK